MLANLVILSASIWAVAAAAEHLIRQIIKSSPLS